MSADGADRTDALHAAQPPHRTASAAPPRAAARVGDAALLLRDPRRGRFLWANAAALGLIGAPSLAEAPATALAALNAAIDAAIDATGTQTILPGAVGAVAGRLERRPVALPDGRVGERVAFWPDAASSGARPAAARGAVGETLISATALARLAHEFRSPLTAVLGFAEFMRENLDDLTPDRIRAYLDDLSLAAARMRRLADDLVAVGAGGAGLTVAETDLDALIESAGRLAAPAARARGVRIAQDAPEPRRRRLTGLVDPDALARAVGNLLDNAIRHGAPTPGAMVRLSIEDLGRDGGAEIVVADEGPGLDPDQLEEAMRLYGRRGDGGAGAAGGLGLPIVREIIEAHGGTLTIDTAPGEGLRARLSIPPARVFRGSPAPMR